MIESMKLLGVLHCHDVLHILHHTNRGSIAARIAADGANIRIADVVTHPAVLHLFLQPFYGFGKGRHILITLSKHVKNQAQGCLAPDSWKFGKLAHRLVKQGRRILAHHNS